MRFHNFSTLWGPAFFQETMENPKKKLEGFFPETLSKLPKLTTFARKLVGCQPKNRGKTPKMDG